MARTFISALNTRHESGNSCLVAELRNTFSFSPLSMMSVVHLLYMAFIILKYVPSGFPHSSVGKESACNAWDPSLISGLGRSTGEGIGCPLQYSWISLMAQLVKNLPAMWETLGLIPELRRSFGEGKGYPIQYSGLENSMDCMGLQRVGHTWATFTFMFPLCPLCWNYTLWKNVEFVKIYIFCIYVICFCISILEIVACKFLSFFFLHFLSLVSLSDFFISVCWPDSMSLYVFFPLQISWTTWEK